MNNFKRIFVVVIDSLGISVMPDGERFGDVGVNTLGHISESVDTFRIPNLQKLGMANLTPLRQAPALDQPLGYRAVLRETSNGKDTMTGHMIVYTSADSVLQICGNEETFDLIPFIRELIIPEKKFRFWPIQNP